MNCRILPSFRRRSTAVFVEQRVLFVESPLSILDVAQSADQKVGKETAEVPLEQIGRYEFLLQNELTALRESHPEDPRIQQVADFFEKTRKEFETFTTSEEMAAQKALQQLGARTLAELSRLEASFDLEQEIPEEFKQLNRHLGYTEAELRVHYAQYRFVSEAQRVPIPRIAAEIDAVLARFRFLENSFPQKAGTQKEAQDAISSSRSLALLVFGILTKGATPQQFRLVEQIKMQTDSLFFSLQAETHLKKLKDLRTEQAAHEKKLEKTFSILNQIIANITLATADNKKPLEFWKPELRAQITEGVYQLIQTQARFEKLEQAGHILDPQIIKEQQALFLQEYKILRNAGNADSVRAHLLKVYDVLGKDIPQELRDEVKAALEAVQNDPQASEFEKAYYRGDYSQALQIGAEKYLRSEWLYEAIETFEADEKTTKSSAPRPISVIRFNRVASYADALNQIYIERLPDGSLQIRTDPNQDAPRLNPGAINSLEAPRKGDHWKIVLSRKEQETRKSERDQAQKNMERAIIKNPDLSYIRAAGKEVQTKLLQLQQLLMVGIDGGKTLEFVQLARKYAADIKRDVAKFPELQARLLQARKDLQPVRGFMAGRMEDVHENFITKTTRDLDQIISLLDAEKLSGLIDQILNSEFDPDDFLKWCKEDLVILLTAIVCGVLMVSVVGAPLGITGLFGTSALGATGYVAGAEIGTTLVNIARDQPLRAQYVQWLTGKMNTADLLMNYTQDWAIFTALSAATVGLGRVFLPNLTVNSPLAIALEELEPLSLIYLLKNQNKKENESLLEQNYGLRYDSESLGYTYSNLTEVILPEGLVIYLERNGFKIEGDPRTGVFIATKGDEKIKFVRSPLEEMRT